VLQKSKQHCEAPYELATYQIEPCEIVTLVHGFSKLPGFRILYGFV
jgi:hypothetical protein